MFYPECCSLSRIHWSVSHDLASSLCSLSKIQQITGSSEEHVNMRRHFIFSGIFSSPVTNYKYVVFIKTLNQVKKFIGKSFTNSLSILVFRNEMTSPVNIIMSPL